MSDELRTLALHVAAWLPALVLFSHVPLVLYRTNQDEFNRQAEVLLPFGLMIVPALGLISTMLVTFPDQANTIAVYLFAIGMYLLLSDMSIPVRLGNVILGVTRDNLLQPVSDSIIQMVLLCGAMACAALLPLADYLPWLALPSALLMIAGTMTLLKLDENNRRSFKRFITGNKPSANTSDATVGKPATGNGNVYHIVLDGYPGRLFADNVDKHRQSGRFDGFTCHKNTLANYLFTYPSVASYMTGSFHPENNVCAWRESWQKAGLIQAYAESGYTVWQYATQTMHWQHENAEYFHPAVDNSSRAKERIVTFADMWLLRTLPVSLRKLAFATESTGRFFHWFMPAWCTGGYLTMDARANLDMIYSFIEDEKKRPATGQYVYMHAYMPHQPYIAGDDCGMNTDATLKSQCECALKLVSEFVEELKSQGKFDDAAIIVQSDHGWIMDKNQQGQFFSFPEPVFSEMEKINTDMLPVWQIPDFAHAMLLIKSPGDSQEMRINEAPVQLADIPQTLKGMTGVGIEPKIGVDVTSHQVKEERDLPVFAGYSCKKGILGMSEFTASIVRLDFNTTHGWRVGETSTVTWE